MYYKLGQVLQIRAIITNWGKQHLKTMKISNIANIKCYINQNFVIVAFDTRGMGTSKIDCGDKIQKKARLFTFSGRNQAMTANGSALIRYAMTISVQKLIQVIKSNIAGFRIQRDKIKILKRMLKRLGLIKKRFPD